MPHDSSLVATIVIGLGLAFVFGTIANRLKVSPIVGYLLAGVAVGPFTPGFVADQALASQLAEIGVILLMFGVGLHFSLKDLLAVRLVVLPGASVQILVSALLGTGIGLLIGWPIGTSIVFGLTLSVASTVVLLRSLTDRRLLDTERGHIAIGWLVFQDLLMVVVLVLLPPLSGVIKSAGPGTSAGVEAATLFETLAVTIGKVAAFIALMLLVGRRGIPAVLHFIAHTGSRELFRLAVLAVALGVAFLAAELFGVSFALGAFFAGMVLSESALSQRAAEETLPLRDAFAVLFFVSVGMLFDPRVLWQEIGPLAGTLLVVLAGGAGTAFVMTRWLGQPVGNCLLLAAGLAQIGEFSFILSDLGIGLGVVPVRARNLVLGTSILTILGNPILFALLDRWKGVIERRLAPEETQAVHEPEPEVLTPTSLKNHAVLVGYGRVGRLVVESLGQANWPFLVIEDAPEAVEALQAKDVELIRGNGVEPHVLAAANLPAARILLVAIPNGFEACQIVQQARALNPGLEIVARAHFDAEVDQLRQYGANVVVMGERELARCMVEHVRTLPSLGDAAEARLAAARLECWRAKATCLRRGWRTLQGARPMKASEVLNTAFSMPLTSPAYPRGPYRFFDREFLVITYRTDPKKLRAIVPEPLEIDEADPLVKFEFIRMPNSTGFGDYTESGQVIPVSFGEAKGGYSHAMYLNDGPPIFGGRELWGFPKKYARPSLDVDRDTLVGTLDYGPVRVATGTMGFKHIALDHDAVLKSLAAPNFLLKIIPHVDGSPRICELVRYEMADVVLKGAWGGPAALDLRPHALAPVADLPVLEVVSAVHLLADLTLGLGKVVHDYLG